MNEVDHVYMFNNISVIELIDFPLSLTVIILSQHSHCTCLHLEFKSLLHIKSVIVVCKFRILQFIQHPLISLIAY